MQALHPSSTPYIKEGGVTGERHTGPSLLSGSKGRIYVAPPQSPHLHHRSRNTDSNLAARRCSSMYVCTPVEMLHLRRQELDLSSSPEKDTRSQTRDRTALPRLGAPPIIRTRPTSGKIRGLSPLPDLRKKALSDKFLFVIVCSI